jgi:hypothetical protein
MRQLGDMQQMTQKSREKLRAMLPGLQEMVRLAGPAATSEGFGEALKKVQNEVEGCFWLLTDCKDSVDKADVHTSPLLHLELGVSERRRM